MSYYSAAWSYPGQQAAVDRDGTVYLSLDLTGMTAPLAFEAEFNGFPLRFVEKDLVFLNTQGFLMQLLTEPGNKKSAVPIPGMSVNPSATPTTTSDTRDGSPRSAHRDRFTATAHSDGSREALRSGAVTTPMRSTPAARHASMISMTRA